MKVSKYKDLAKGAFIELNKYQKKQKHVVKFGVPYFDDLFPVINGSVITFSAPSGVGKSYMLGMYKRNILNKEINPLADSYAMLDVSLEMRMMSLVLRDISSVIGKKKKDILLSEYTEEERIKVTEYYKNLMTDERMFFSQEAITPSTFYTSCDKFLEEHKDKSSVIISLDHMALVGADKGDSRNSSIEKLNERINDLKLKHENVIFILLSQMNDGINKRAVDKSILAHPRDTDLYYSNFTFQISDYVAVMVNPYKLGVGEYSKLYTERYPNLEDFFLEEDSKGRASLITEGVNYIHLLKCREAEPPFIDIYPHMLNKEAVANKKKEAEKTTLSIQPPIFEKDDAPIKALNEDEVEFT